MDINALLYAAGATGLFASRAFLPALLTACYLRWGQGLPLIGNAEMFQNVGGEPTWFTSDWCITALAVLSLLEMLADKVPEAEEALSLVQKHGKSALAILTYMGVTTASDSGFVEKTIQVAYAGFFDIIPAAALGGLVYVFAGFRDSVLGYLRQLDEDNDIGLRNLISWLEEGWILLGLFLLILYPPLMLIFLAFLYGVLARIRRHYAKREEAMKVACAACGAVMYKTARECPACHAANPAVYAVGRWGQAKDYLAEDARSHAIDLLEAKRCPKCATHLHKHSVHQNCPACGYEVFSERTIIDAYRSRVALRLPLVLVLCFLVGMIPIVGLIIGVLIYRLQLVAPYRRYLPIHRSFFAKWMARLVFMVLIFFQLIPVVGGLSVSIMALISYNLYRKGFVNQ